MLATTITGEQTLKPETDIPAQDAARALVVTLGDLPPDMTDKECNAVIIAAAGGSRGEVARLMGHTNIDSATHWKAHRSDIIRQASENIRSLLSGVNRLGIAQLVLSGLEHARALTLRGIGDDESTGDVADRLLTIARAAKELSVVGTYLDQAGPPSDPRLGARPSWSPGTRAMAPAKTALASLSAVLEYGRSAPETASATPAQDDDKRN